jgi:hypothetical protein
VKESIGLTALKRDGFGHKTVNINMDHFLAICSRTGRAELISASTNPTSAFKVVSACIFI